MIFIIKNKDFIKALINKKIIIQSISGIILLEFYINTVHNDMTEFGKNICNYIILYLKPMKTFNIIFKNNIRYCHNSNNIREYYDKDNLSCSTDYRYKNINKEYIIFDYLHDTERILYNYIYMLFIDNKLDNDIILIIIIKDYEDIYERPLIEFKKYLDCLIYHDKTYHVTYEPKNIIINNRDILIALIKYNTKYLKYADPLLIDDDIIMYYAIYSIPYNILSYANERQLSNKELVYLAVCAHGYNLQYACPELQKDIEIINGALNQNGLSLQYVSPELQDDKEIVMKAVTNNGLSLQYASFKLQDNKEIVMKAVNDNGLSLQYASFKLQDDKEIVIIAIENNIESLNFASPRLQIDKQIIMYPK